MKKLKSRCRQLVIHRKRVIIAFILGYILLVSTLILNFFLHRDPFYFFRKSLGEDIERLVIDSDLDDDGVLDLEDILIGAREQVKIKPTYKSTYYAGGYPPEKESVCTDLVWRALDNAGYNLKDAMDADIKEYKEDYPRVDIPDPNIDFRRVKNQYVFFEKYFKSLTMDVIAYDVENLKEWQAGDIVVFENPDHVAIISDKRRKDGVPYIIHSSWKYPKEEDKLLYWYEKGRIIGHYRFEDVE